VEVAVCHWIRDAEFERERGRAALPPSEPMKAPPRRLVGALGAIAVAAVAAVVLLFPAGTPAEAPPPQQASVADALPVPVAHSEGIRQTSIAPDDPAPVSTASRAAAGHCDHDM
jgi:hypothetical protein